MKKISATILDQLVREAKNHEDGHNLNAVLKEHGAQTFFKENVAKATIEGLFQAAKNRLEALGVIVYGK